MSMILEVAGKQYTNFIRATATVSMEDFGSTFSFVASANNDNRLPFKAQQDCSVYIDDNKILTGTIENIIISYDYESHNIFVSGRGKTSDFSDSYLDSVNDLTASLKLEDIIQKLVDSIKDLNITVNVNVNNTTFNDATEILTPSVGQNAFDFCDTLCRMKQVLLTEDEDGNILITRTSNEIYNDALKMIVDGDDNNILSAEVNYDYSNVFRTYIVRSQVNVSVSSIKAKFGVKEITNQNNNYTDTNQRKGRQFVVMAEQNSTGLTLGERAKWEADIRRARSNEYKVKVNGFSNNNEIWKPNKKINVNDQLAGIDAVMLIKTVTYNLDIEEGSTTELVLTDQNAFTLELSGVPKGEDVGDSFAKKFN